MTDEILVFGASQRTGLETVKMLRGRGDKVRAFVRPSSDCSGLDELGVEYATGNVLDAESVDGAVGAGNIRAIVCTIGGSRTEPRPDVDGAHNIVNAALHHGVQRIVLVTAIGAGDSRAAINDNVWKFLGPVLELKTQAEACLSDSALDWTILRPGGMGSEPATGTAIKTEDHAVMGMIQRADLAALIIDCLDDDQTIGRIYHTIDPEAKEQAPLQRGEQLQAGTSKP
ncbi:MAG: SDR family oxidoreductase [Gammaproteobacteria bacterium]|nr:SDR family oxidoreductase [Gammaproteobacteria bacterium]